MVGCYVTFEELNPPAWAVRVHPAASDVSADTPFPGSEPGAAAPEVLCRTTVERDPSDPTGKTAHLMAMEGDLPWEAVGQIKDGLRRLGFARMRWERRSGRTGKLRSVVFAL